jgi:adenylate cyclase
MGSSERMEYAVIGDVVNVSSRLESLEKQRMDSDCRVLVSGSTLELVDGQPWQLSNWGHFPLKGRDQTVDVYELIATIDQSC